MDAREGGVGGPTSLVHAVIVDDRPLLELMISSGASVNVTITGGYTPLMLAALHDRIHILRSLVAAGADPNLKDRKGRTAVTFVRSTAAAETLMTN